MADPTDPQTAALANIQNAGRTYNRGRRRGAQANTDPAFLAAVETTDPAARREALAQYARGRASELFPGQAGSAPPNGRDVVNQAFPQGDAFAPVVEAAAPLPTQADVMSQVAPRRAVPMGQRMDEANAKMREEASGMGADLGRVDPALLERFAGAGGDHQARMEMGRGMLRGAPGRDGGITAMDDVENARENSAYDRRQADADKMFLPSPGEGAMEPEPGESAAHEASEPVEEPSGIESIGAAAYNIRRTIQARRGR